MDKKPTDNEIVKALECCKYEYDTKCELCGYNFYSRTGCRSELRRNALDLINRLQDKNKNLQERNVILKGLVDTQKAENERLKEEKSKLENKINEIYPLIMQLPNAMQQAKAEAYKEILNKVCTLENQSLINKTAAKKLKNLLKEIVGEQPILNDVKCKDCEYLELELPYAVCSKAHKGIVAPDDSCGKGKLKELVGDKNAKEKE